MADLSVVNRRGHAECTDNLSAATLTEFDAAGEGAAIAAAGAGRRHYLTDLLITCDVACTVQILGGATVILKTLYVPAAGMPYHFPGRGLDLGEAKQPKLSLAATAGGNAVAAVEAWLTESPE